MVVYYFLLAVLIWNTATRTGLIGFRVRPRHAPRSDGTYFALLDPLFSFICANSPFNFSTVDLRGRDFGSRGGQFAARGGDLACVCASFAIVCAEIVIALKAQCADPSAFRRCRFPRPGTSCAVARRHQGQKQHRRTAQRSSHGSSIGWQASGDIMGDISAIPELAPPSWRATASSIPGGQRTSQ